DELGAAISKAVQNISSRTNQNTQVINLIRNLESSPADQKFVVHTGSNVRIVNDRDVVIICANGRYCCLSLQSGESLITARSLKEFEDYFEGKTNFVRISKTHIINAAYIREYSKGDPFIIKMSNG
ncbi:MAG TPA: LytTR family DNA-binding domain-containing protein, partial [Flavobacterium sp.]|nr:LytTR family DNA-binding domain-containing protein [Flavobacterium sp.]